MGQNSSTQAGVRRDRRKSLRESWRSPFPRRTRTHQGPLSAAFHFNDVDLKVDQLNVNTASEEELMTLPGISRSVAQNIVEYRQVIGCFKKVEDLALVSGIGAEKLDLIRPEICVSRRKNASCASSRAQSLDSIPSTDSSIFVRHIKGSPNTQSTPVNINTASVFELMAVPGLNQELAANIVEYRDKKGFFRTTEDLIKVKGFNQWRVGALRHLLVVKNSTEDAPDIVTCNGITKGSTSQNCIANGKVPDTRTSVSLKKRTTDSFLPVNDIFELLSAYSQRPILEEVFHGLRNGKPALRLATWNLQKFTLEKVENPGVLEVICRTILENSFSLLAIQDIIDDISIKQICDELNSPTLRRIKDWKNNERKWKCALPSSQIKSNEARSTLGFLYDSSCNIELLSMKQLCIIDSSTSSTPEIDTVIAVFKVGALKISVLNVAVLKGDICSIQTVVQDHLKETSMLVIMGDFSGLSQNKGESEITRLQYKSVIPTSWNTYSCCSNPQACQYFDNIFMNSEVQLQYTGISGIVRQGLNHLAIPCGWKWGGNASEHCPVWCEIYTEPSDTEKQIANGVHLSE